MQPITVNPIVAIHRLEALLKQTTGQVRRLKSNHRLNPILELQLDHLERINERVTEINSRKEEERVIRKILRVSHVSISARANVHIPKISVNILISRRYAILGRG